jgi:hypothetical protein
MDHLTQAMELARLSEKTLTQNLPNQESDLANVNPKLA